MRAAAANPTGITMAMAIERYFNVALYLLVLTGFGTLASTGGLDLLAVVVVGCALIIRGYHLITHQQFTIPERWTTYLTLLYVAIYFADYFFVSRSFLVATVHLVLFGMVIRLFSLQRARDHFMLAVLSFLMVLAAAVLTVDSVFLFCFAGFLLVAVITFVLMEMRHSIAEDQGRAQEPKDTAPYRRMASVLLATAPMLMLMILAGGSLIFFLLPRVSSRYLSAYAPGSDLSTGFSDRVQLGRIGQIQQSSAVVMHIQIDNDLEGAYDLRWRGVALSQFDGKVWSNPFAQTDLRNVGDGTYRLGTVAGETASLGISGRKVHYRVLMEPLGTNVFFLAEKPARLIGNFGHVSTDAGGAVYNLDSDHPVNRYEAESELELNVAAFTMAEVEEMLHVIQQLDPPGIAARNLRECLMLQLENRKRTDTLVYRLVKEAFDDLIAHRWSDLGKRFGLAPDEVQRAADELARLDPKPGLQHSAGNDAYIIPDLIVEKIDDKYHVFLNDGGLPRLRISRTYQEIARDKKKYDVESKEFINQRLNSAHWMIQAIEQRRQTMLKVMNFIVDRQREFFEKGVEYLKPLTLREVADVINMHESTVSRVTNEKYVQTPRGLLPLKFFFSSGLSTTTGEDASARAIRAQIQKMVADEDPKNPLTDQQIVEMFERKGVKIARRTVAKYRDQLGILPARMRKRL